MPQPYDYTIKTRPGALIEGLELARASADRRRQLDMQAQQQKIAMGKLAEEALARKLARDKFEAEQKQKVQERNDVLNFIGQKDKTQEDYQNLMLKYPDRFQGINASIERMTENQKKAEAANLASIYYPLKRGNTEDAISNAEKLAKAYEDSGDEKNATMIRDLKTSMLESNPKAIMPFMEFVFAQTLGPDEWGQIVGTGIAQEKAPLEKEKLKEETKGIASGTVLKDTQAAKTFGEIQKLGIETKKLLLEVAGMEKGEIPPEKKFDLEKKLRDEYVGRIKNYNELDQHLSKLLASPTEKGKATGPSDIALVFSFMKMLDPGSVVRDTEFAQAANAGGLYEYLKGLISKGKEGPFLTEKTRREYKALAQKYMDAAKEYEYKQRKDLSIPVDSYNLNAENVFGRKETKGMIEADSKEGKQLLEDVEAAKAKQANKVVINRGKDKSGRTVVQYSDGTTAYE